MKARTLSKVERISRPIIRRLPNRQVISIYSRGRVEFMNRLKEESGPRIEILGMHNHWERHLWGLKHRSPLMNAAGMFKNGECYDMVFNQGAGAYMGGTGTFNQRDGNTVEGIHLPFVTYPKSGAASNFLGLPNDGDNVNASRAGDLHKINKKRDNGIPIWWSVMGSPDFDGKEKLLRLVESMRMYDFQGVDVLEENESCPNTGEKLDFTNLWKTMNYVSENFIKRLERDLPVVLKLSNDVDAGDVPEIMDAAFSKGYSGINFGNTSTNYQEMFRRMRVSEIRLFTDYTGDFKGGVSGRPLKEKSLELASKAVEYLRKGPPSQEFHVIRTGGIESLSDVIDSGKEGIHMNQWHTGYWEMLREHGDKVYEKFFEGEYIY